MLLTRWESGGAIIKDSESRAPAYLDLEFEVTEFADEPMVREPHRIESWKWYPLDELPVPLFKPCQLAIASLPDDRLLNDG